jgi:hypothetical protein
MAPLRRPWQLLIRLTGTDDVVGRDTTRQRGAVVKPRAVLEECRVDRAVQNERGRGPNEIGRVVVDVGGAGLSRQHTREGAAVERDIASEMGSGGGDGPETPDSLARRPHYRIRAE